MRRAVVGGVVAALVTVLAPATASANVVWCLDDPPQQVTTAGGTNLVVGTKLYAPAAERHALSSVTEKTVTASDGAGGTLVTEYVTVPASISQLMVVSTVQRFSVTATGQGTSGSVIVLTLDVPTS